MLAPKAAISFQRSEPLALLWQALYIFLFNNLLFQWFWRMSLYWLIILSLILFICVAYPSHLFTVQKRTALNSQEDNSAIQIFSITCRKCCQLSTVTSFALSAAVWATILTKGLFNTYSNNVHVKIWHWDF